MTLRSYILTAMDNKMNEELSVKDEDNAPAETLTPTEETWAPWDRLPYCVIVQVYNYLKDLDRVAMAQVCQAWYNSFKDPSLWRSREFNLEESNGEKMIHFASIFGNCLKNVEIACLDKTAQSETYIQKTLEKLMEILENARLCRLELYDIEPNNVFHRTNKFKEALARCVIKLFKSQTALKHVALMNLQLYNKHGTEVLKVLQESSGQTLESLKLIGFFQSHVRLSMNDLLKYELLYTDIEKFTNLKEISVNLRYITEEIIQRWTDDQKLKLNNVTLNVMDYELPCKGRGRRFHKISSSTWMDFTKAFPHIEVDLVIYHYSRNMDIIKMLAQRMPLSCLYIMSRMEKKHDLKLSSFLTDLAAKFDKKLVSFQITLPDIEDPVLKEIMQAFKNIAEPTDEPDDSVIGVINVILDDFCKERVRKVQFSIGRNEDSPYVHLSQDDIKTLNDMLSNIQNLKVEWIDED